MSGKKNAGMLSYFRCLGVFRGRRSKTIRIRWTEPKPIACSLCLSPSLYPDFKRSLFKNQRPLCLLSKSQKMNQRQFSFRKFYWEACSQNRPFIARYFHLPYSTHTHLSNKNPAYGRLRAFKNASLHSGVWQGNSRDPQFGQNIVRDLRNVNVKRNFTATGLETGLRKFGQGCEM